MRTIKKIDCQAAGKVYAFFTALIAFFTSLGIAITNVYHIFLTGDYTLASIAVTIVFNLVIGILVGLISALVGAIIGYITGVVIAWVYNKTVRLTGGIKIDLE